jgi:hypothetical protein
MVIIIFLPKPHARFLLIFVTCLLLETPGHSKEIATLRLTECQEVQVVGHYAIGIHDELMQKRFGLENVNNPYGFLVVLKNWMAVLAAHYEEIPFLAEVFLRREMARFAWEIQLVSPDGFRKTDDQILRILGSIIRTFKGPGDLAGRPPKGGRYMSCETLGGGWRSFISSRV